MPVASPPRTKPTCASCGCRSRSVALRFRVPNFSAWYDDRARSLHPALTLPQFERLGLDATGFDALFAALDANGDGVVTLDEWVAGMRLLKGGQRRRPSRNVASFLGSSHDAAALFALCDTNGDGRISRSELAHVLASHSSTALSATEFEELWAMLDRNDDKSITLDEWTHALRWEGARHAVAGDATEQPTAAAQLTALEAYVRALHDRLVATAQRAADKGMTKTAHAVVDIVDWEALAVVEAAVGKPLADPNMRARVAAIHELK